jgi:Rad3-related DNA helicase
VIIIGLPYPPLKDPKVELKRKYLDETKKKNPKVIMIKNIKIFIINNTYLGYKLILI